MTDSPTSAHSTGIPSLDEMLKGLMPGDNLVWLVDDIDEYRRFVDPFRRYADETGRDVVYFRYSAHPPLIEKRQCKQWVELDANAGFETFVTDIRRVVERYGSRGYFVFDRLSHLVVDWYSDQMLGNFFQLTCPHVLQHRGIAYFALRKGHHSSHATSPIAETTQILIDVYRRGDQLFLHPLKVQGRYSRTMFMLHAWRDGMLTPVTDSDVSAEVLGGVEWSGVESADQRLDVWNRSLVQAETMLREEGEEAAGTPRETGKSPEPARLFPELLRMVVTREERILRVADRRLRVGDVVAIGKRMIGTGLIGGKAAGMLIARAIVREAAPELARRLEPHDSFFVGADVFYTYLVRNGCWWMRAKHPSAETLLEDAERVRRQIQMGTFPDYILRRFSDMLDYFGQSPIIVRSSSLLEDNYGNAFSGKYESVFCPNQGTRKKRLDEFVLAVKAVYASSMSAEALLYRAQRGILERDEQMALLVQRVSGSFHNNLFFPQAAGVGYSFNPYVWSCDIDPRAGVVRVVFGLGTRAVNRADDDYTRVVALNAPDRRCAAGFDERRRFTQRKVDLIDLGAGRFRTMEWTDLLKERVDFPPGLFAGDDGAEGQVVEFDGFFERTPFVADMKTVLRLLEDAYGCPVDIEFTANVFSDGRYRLNLVQCRPFSFREGGSVPALPTDVSDDRKVFETDGPVIGRGRVEMIQRIIYVVPSVYCRLRTQERYSVARLIGELTRLEKSEAGARPSMLLIGPGRWGSTTPTLGVPVSFAEINTARAVCEVVAMGDGLVPDVSLGTHFFNDLVETDMLYMALFPERAGHMLRSEMLERAPNRLAELLPDAAAKAECVRVIEAADIGEGRPLRLHADPYQQKVLCCL